MGWGGVDSNHLIPIRMATSKTNRKKRKQTTQILQDVEKLEACALLVGIQNQVAAVETGMVSPQKIKNGATK